MANMSYCAFENTKTDLAACLEMLQEAQENGQTLAQFIESRSSDYERRAVKKLVSLCNEVCEVVEFMEDNELAK